MEDREGDRAGNRAVDRPSTISLKEATRGQALRIFLPSTNCTIKLLVLNFHIAFSFSTVKYYFKEDIYFCHIKRPFFCQLPGYIRFITAPQYSMSILNPKRKCLNYTFLLFYYYFFIVHAMKRLKFYNYCFSPTFNSRKFLFLGNN